MDDRDSRDRGTDSEGKAQLLESDLGSVRFPKLSQFDAGFAGKQIPQDVAMLGAHDDDNPPASVILGRAQDVFLHDSIALVPFVARQTKKFPNL